MKRSLWFCSSLLLLHSAHAEIRVPGSVRTLAELEKAKSEAVGEKKPLVFVVTDPGST